MSFYDNKYKLFSEWEWISYGKGNKVSIEEFIETHPDAQFYIGTDSQNYSKKGNRYCTFTTVLVAYTMGKGGCAILASEKTEKMDNLRQRLMIEAMRSLEVGWFLDKKIDQNRIVTIHLDVNDSIKFKSGKYKDELVGFVTAQGFECQHKPNAWAASWAADKFC